MEVIGLAWAFEPEAPFKVECVGTIPCRQIALNIKAAGVFWNSPIDTGAHVDKGEIDDRTCIL
jgi:hypothetical protein